MTHDADTLCGSAEAGASISPMTKSIRPMSVAESTLGATRL